MTSGIPGSTYEPHLDTAHRLAVWRRLATRGLTRDEIAAELGVKRTTLDQLVGRARRAGHPDAIRHPHAVDTGSGFWHIARGRRRTGGNRG